MCECVCMNASVNVSVIKIEHIASYVYSLLARLISEPYLKHRYSTAIAS